MTEETSARPEHETPAEFARRLHGRLSELLLTTKHSGDAHYAYIAAPTTRIRVSDYFFYEHQSYRLKLDDNQPEAYRAALETGQAILDIQAEDTSGYIDLPHCLVFRPCDIKRGHMLYNMATHSSGMNMDGAGYVVWSMSAGQITDPDQYALLRDVSQ